MKRRDTFDPVAPSSIDRDRDEDGVTNHDRTVQDQAPIIAEDGGVPSSEAIRAVELSALLEERDRRILELEGELDTIHMAMGILSHDLRTPLGAVWMSAQAALSRPPPTFDPKVLTRIVASVGRMLRMTEQLLDVSRIRLGGGLPLDRGRANLEEICREISDELVMARPGSNVDLEVDGDTIGAWDRDRLAQLVSNLLANALEHAPARAARVSIDGRQGDQVVLRVWSPSPIPEEVRPFLFQPFRRPAGHRSSGLGLGLFIAKQIVEGHAGALSFVSSPEEGTTFTVELPRPDGAR